MAIEISAGGISRKFQRYPNDVIRLGNGAQVKEVWANGVKYYPEESVETEMDIYEQRYYLDYAADSSDGCVYATIGDGTSSFYGVQIQNCIVTGKMRYFIPKNVPMGDCAGEIKMLKAECYRHNSYTVTCDIPDQMRSYYGGLKEDICDQLERGYVFDDYSRRAINGANHVKTIDGSSSFLYLNCPFGCVGGGLVGLYKNNKYRLYIRNRRSGYNGYNSPTWRIFSSFPINYLGTGAPEDYITAIGLFK